VTASGRLLDRLDRVARRCLPVAFTLLLVLASVLPLRLPEATPAKAVLPLLAVYYWAVYRPDLLPAAAVFLIGLLHDILAGLPIGLSTAVLLAVYGVVVRQRRFLIGRSFAVVWWGLTIAGLGGLALQWALGSALVGAVVDPVPIALQYALLVALYPPLGWGFARVLEMLPQRAE
jgi:rod shape-determining protein MreD